MFCNKAQPVSKIKDYFCCVEFKQRGSPHIHILVWIKDAPLISNHTDEATDFVNLYITCKKIMNWQISLIVKHPGICMLIHAAKKIMQFVDFGFHFHHCTRPWFCMDWRKIRRTIKKPEKILKLLNKHLKLGTENAMNFHEFLLSLNLSYNEYVLAFKSDIKEGQAKVFFAKENIRNKSK